MVSGPILRPTQFIIPTPVFPNLPPVRQQKSYLTFQDLSTVQPADVLAVFAHPDDELFLSATLAQLAREGKQVQVVYATNGSAGEDVSGQQLSGDTLGEVRANELVRALQRLGIQRPPMILDFMDGQTSLAPEALKEQLRSILTTTRPGSLLMYNAQDGLTGHTDHKNVAKDLESVLNTVASGQTFRDLQDRQALSKLLQNQAIYEAVLPKEAETHFRTFFPLSNHSWRDVQFQPNSPQQVKVPISSEIAAKKTASLQQHHTQYLSQDVQNLASYFKQYPYEAYTHYQIQSRQATNPFNISGASS